MDRTISGYIEASEPGPWRDALEGLARAEGAHRALCRELMPDHEAYYGSPEGLRPMLDPRLAESVRRIEESAASLVGVRDRIYPARDEAFAGEAARLGGLAKTPGEPDWVRLMRDLHALRAWRRAHLDGIDVHLPALVLRPKEKGRVEPQMLERALMAWSKAARIPLKALVGRIAELDAAGLIPAVSAVDPLGRDLGTWAPSHRKLDELLVAEGAEALLAEVSHAAGVLPADAFPVPRETMDALRAALAPAP